MRQLTRWTRVDTWAILAFAITASIIFARLGLAPLLNPDEGRNAEIAREMALSAGWLVPTYDGLPYLDKPALLFKLVGISFAIFGTSEFAARFPLALAAFSLLLLLHAFCRREYDRRTAAVAVIVVGTTPLFFAFARIVIVDMLLALFVCSAIFAGFIAETKNEDRRARWYLLFAAAAAGGTLVKGPVGFILPVLVIWIFNRVDARKGTWRRIFAPGNLLVFLLIVAPWFVGVSVLHPDFPYYGLVLESLQRFTTDEFHRSQPFYYYPPVIFATFFAWSLVVPESMLAAWRRRTHLTRADRLLIVWAVVVTLFFSMSRSKLPGYVLTAVVALGVLVARVFVAALVDPVGRPARIIRHAAAALAVIASLAGLGALGYALIPESFRALPRIKADLVEAVRPVLSFVAVALLVVGATSGIAALRSDARAALAAFAMLPLLLVSATFSAYVALSELRSDRLLAARIASLADTGEIACLRCFPGGLSFYLNRNVTVITRKDGAELTSNYVKFSLARAAQWPSHIVRFDDFERWLASREQPVILLATERDALTVPAVAVRQAEVIRLTSQYWGVLLSPSKRN